MNAGGTDGRLNPAQLTLRTLVKNNCDKTSDCCVICHFFIRIQVDLRNVSCGTNIELY